MLNPAALWLLVGVAIAAVLAIIQRRDGLFVITLRSAALALLIIALADPAKEASKSHREIVALFDASYSISPKARRALLDMLSAFRTDDSANDSLTLQLVPFAKNPSSQPIEIDSSLSASDLEDAVSRAAEGLDTGETNIGKAVRDVVARAESSSVLLLSDGLETAGNAVVAARAAAGSGVSIFPLVPDESAFLRERLNISSLHAPITVNAGDQATIRASVENLFDQSQEAMLELWLDNEKLSSETIRVEAGREKLITVKTPPTKGGLHRIRASLTPKGSSKDKTVEKHRWISVKEKAKVLLISGAKEDQRVLRRLLTLKGYALESIVADGSKPIPTKFDGFSGIILNNASKRQLPKGFLEALRGFVKKGGGLVMLGGERSFGLGGYIKTPLEEISPVNFVPPQTKKRRLNNAVVLVMDKSRSMVFEGKIHAAKAAAETAISTLKDDDYVGVIGFDSTPFIIIRLARVDKVKPIARRRLRNLTAAGKTNLLPALAQARQGLRKAPASRKHIIVLSDGKFPLAGSSYVDEIGRLRKLGITVSTVALGREADVPFMKTLSNYGKGAFYHTLDPSQLPEIFLHDIKVSTGERTMKEKKDFNIAIGPDGVRSTSIKRFPHLRGFVETKPKDGAAIELITKSQKKTFPVLASWRYGSGQVIAYTSDANGRWSLPWLKWRGFSKFWSQVTEHVKDKTDRKTGDINFDLRYSVNHKSIYLDLAIFDDKLRSQASPKISAKIIQPGGETSEIGFREEKRGRFSGVIENGRPGDYRIEVKYGDLELPPVAITLGGELFGEIPGNGVNVQNLSQLAYLTGGSLNPTPEQIEAPRQVSKKSEHLFPPLALLAFLIILFEAFWRELGSGFFTQFFRRRKGSGPKLQRGNYQPKKRAA